MTLCSGQVDTRRNHAEETERQTAVRRDQSSREDQTWRRNNLLSVCVRADRETAARITEEIGNLMKEIETLVEEKKKDSSDMAKMITPQESRSNLPTFVSKLLRLKPFHLLTRGFSSWRRPAGAWRC